VPKYIPISIEYEVEHPNGNLLGLDFKVNSFTADFDLVGDGRALRIQFDRQCIVRIWDEMQISTEREST
jgi:hypothetical protein